MKSPSSDTITSTLRFKYFLIFLSFLQWGDYGPQFFHGFIIPMNKKFNQSTRHK